MQVSRKHAVTVCSGLIFDHNEPQPLPITCLNLERCIGEAYEESVVRGYEFHQLPPKAQGRKRKGRRERSSAVENASPNERQ